MDEEVKPRETGVSDPIQVTMQSSAKSESRALRQKIWMSRADHCKGLRVSFFMPCLVSEASNNTILEPRLLNEATFDFASCLGSRHRKNEYFFEPVFRYN